MLKVRQPSDDEVMELVEYLRMEGKPSHKEIDEEMEAIRSLIETSMISVCDNYMSDSPGYSGKLMMVVWPGSANSYEVFTFKGDQIFHLNQERAFFQKESKPF